MNDGGAIVLNASIAGIKGFPAMSVYSATKQPRAPSLVRGLTICATGAFA